MNNVPAHVWAFLIGLVGIIGIIVLAATSHPVPSVLPTVTIAALAAGAGISVPAGVIGSSAAPKVPA